MTAIAEPPVATAEALEQAPLTPANGLELLKYMREVAPSALTIFLTGHARFEYAREAMRYGCFDYVLKPVDHDVLKDIVRRAIEEIERCSGHQFDPDCAQALGTVLVHAMEQDSAAD